ncbi:hypothetical protein, partial [Mycolicibacter minnesotensis]
MARRSWVFRTVGAGCWRTAAVVRTCDVRYGSSVVGFQDGWRGLLENR